MVILLTQLRDSNKQVWIKYMFWFLILYYAVVSAILSGVLAHHKNRDAGIWVLYSLFMPLEVIMGFRSDKPANML